MNEMELLITLFAENSLYTAVAIFVMIDSIVWLLKQGIMAMRELLKLFKKMEELED